MLVSLPFDVRDIDTIIYDLDGTLYENQEQYDYYAGRLACLLPKAERDGFRQDLLSAREGCHALAYGWTYHLQSRLLLWTDGMRPGPAIAGRDWNGEQITGRLLDNYPHVLHDMKQYVTASDPWWLPFVCAVHHGVRPLKTQLAYGEAREMMLGEKFIYSAPMGLATALRELSCRYHQVLATNSPERDANRVFEALRISDGFDLLVYRAGKPEGLCSVIEMCRHSFRVEAPGVLSIGDNPFNEVVPALTSGAKALLVDSAGCYRKGFQLTLRFDSLSDVLPILLAKAPFREPFGGVPERRELGGF
jgi:FMN phosphatase YigB (HAD superfamily)